MNTRTIVLTVLLSLGSPVFAHRLDEYLQATLLLIESGRVSVSMRLIPGVAVSNSVTIVADSNHDGVLSDTEQRAYAEVVLHDLILNQDGHSLITRLKSVSFPSPEKIQSGLGEIHIEFEADLPGGGPQRTLTIENHHRPEMSVYLMNCIVPRDPDIRVIAQSRNQSQSSYRVEYTQSGSGGSSRMSLWKTHLLPVLSPFTGVPEMFRLGMRHIGEGTDHLLFLLVLLLPAPLSAIRNRWVTVRSVQDSLIEIVRVVSAFTVGHSFTLLLGAWGMLTLPASFVETVIAISILVSAIHAWRALFPGREPAVAASFGLVHGLAFSTTLQNLGIGSWQRLASILGFNLGIEAMQLFVVAALLPSLIVLSRTSVYGMFRCCCALAAGLAATGWTLERLFGVPLSIDEFVGSVASRGGWIALILAVISSIVWLRQKFSARSELRMQPETPAGPEGM